MKGLYLLSNPALKGQHTIKFGMSEDLARRLYDYASVFTNNIYEYCYEMPYSSKQQILFIEAKVLQKAVVADVKDIHDFIKTIRDTIKGMRTQVASSTPKTV
jgi:hypothetical protein